MKNEIQQNITSNQERVLLIGLYGTDIPRFQAQEYIKELELLADTAGAETREKLLQQRDQPDPGTYIGKGKLEEIAEYARQNIIDAVIFDDELTATQTRNIERILKTKVLDRSGLILDIFALRAKTAAAKTQVELAQLQYLLPKLTRYWTHLSRQKGGIGTKGPGETQIETDRRLIGKRIALLKEKLQKLDVQRATQRKSRSDLLRIALVGYTNTGKSSLMNAIADKSDVAAEDQLFATLDATVRKTSINRENVLLSDTVGFIRKLPHRLIESFKSTLDEVREADVLIHVADAASPVLEEYIDTVNETLEEIQAHSKPVILVLNKIDELADKNELTGLQRTFPGAVMTSATRGIGLEEVRDRIRQQLEKNYITREMEIPHSNYKAVSYLHEVAEIHDKDYGDQGIRVSFRINKRFLGGLKQLLSGKDAEQLFVG